MSLLLLLKNAPVSSTVALATQTSLAVAAAGPAFSVGATTTGGTNANVTSTTVTGLSTTIGDRNIVEIFGAVASATPPTDIVAPTGWTLRSSHSQSASATPFVWILESDAVGAGASSSQVFSFAGQSLNIEWYLTPVTGADPAGAIQGTVFYHNRASTTTTDSISGTTTVGGYLFFG